MASWAGHSGYWTITHPTTKDQAFADDELGKEEAIRTLRREATEQGVNPRINPTAVWTDNAEER